MWTVLQIQITHKPLTYIYEKIQTKALEIYIEFPLRRFLLDYEKPLPPRSLSRRPPNAYPKVLCSSRHISRILVTKVQNRYMSSFLGSISNKERKLPAVIWTARLKDSKQISGFRSFSWFNQVFMLKRSCLMQHRLNHRLRDLHGKHQLCPIL